MTATVYSDGVSRRPNAPATAIGAWVRNVRESHGLSQEEFGARLRPSRPVHFTSVNRWEGGKQGIRYSNIQLIRKAFPDAPPLPVDGLSDPSATVPPAAKKGRYEVESEQGTFVAKIFDAMPKEERTEALRVCLNALKELNHPSELGADKGRHRAQPK
jgi:transcriptional regulator with XRE-family HTH domain